MFHPLSLFVGLRYTRSRRRNHFISFISLISMLGIMLVRSVFERESEALALFGGVTLFPLMILGIFVPLPEPVILGVMVLVWFAAALVPDLLLRRRLRTWPGIAALLGMQSGFSLAQAVMGALLLMGRSV